MAAAVELGELITLVQTAAFGATPPSAREAANDRLLRPNRTFVAALAVFRSCPISAAAESQSQSFSRPLAATCG
jgi:hypothetical protein